jgi:hypothetical protein
MLIDCDTCAVRDLRCGDCVMTVLLDAPGTSAHVREVDVAEQAALDALADSGLVPRLQLVPLGLPRLRDGAGPTDGSTQHAV